MNSCHITALWHYPVKSARGCELALTTLTDTGLQHDRRWMLIDGNGRFLTQRELPKLALLTVAIDGDALSLQAANLAPVTLANLPTEHQRSSAMRRVRIWKDDCAAFDCGDDVARQLSDWLQHDVRLVRFDEREARYSNAAWTSARRAPNFFSDGFPILIANEASLADLNVRMGLQLPMNRFRPNIVIDGLPAFEEDHVAELWNDEVRLALVKPCTRCVITTTNQLTGEREGDEPLRTLRGFRHDATLNGVTFAQNAIILAGVGARLRIGDALKVRFSSSADTDR